MNEKIIIAAAIEGLIKSLIESSTPILRKLKDEIKNLFNNGYYDYLEKQYKKHLYIKTILHRTTPKYFYNIYYPLNLENENEIIKTDSVKNLFKKSNFITIIGEAGGGKSTLGKHLFMQTIHEKYAIPLFIELRYLNQHNNDLESYIRGKIMNSKLCPNDSILNRLLNSGSFLFFLDGYDEIITAKKEKNIEYLNSFINKYSLNKYILTSRPYINAEWLQLFHNYKLCTLGKKDIDKFIKKQGLDEEITTNIITSINKNYNTYIKDFLRNPLLLSLYILTFNSHSKIPNKKYLFYRRVIEVLFSEHDGLTKSGFERKHLSGLNYEQYEDFLKRFSFVSFFDGVYDFEKSYTYNLFNKIKNKTIDLTFNNKNLINDLKVNVALWVEDDGLYSFTHRSLQEYFTALYIKESNNKVKKIVYEKKINECLLNRHNEIGNFLSLCEEMDEINYYEYFLLPFLKDVYNIINNDNLSKSIESFLCYFYLSFYLTFDKDKEIVRRRTIVSNNFAKYRTIIRKNNYDFSFFNFLELKSIKEEFLKNKQPASFDEQKKNSISFNNKSKNEFEQYYIDIDNKKDRELMIRLIEKEPKVVKSFIKELEKKINFLESSILKYNRFNEDLLSLI